MSTELTINNLLPVLTTGKLSDKNATILNTTFVGIDFGTSTTVVSIAVLGKNKEPLIVKPIELNQKLSDGAIFSSYKVPSVIAWYNNNLIVGEGATGVINRTLPNAKIGTVHNVHQLTQLINQISQITIAQQKLDFRIENIHVLPLIGNKKNSEKFSVTIRAKSTVPSLSNLKIWMDNIKNQLSNHTAFTINLVVHIDYQ